MSVESRVVRVEAAAIKVALEERFEGRGRGANESHVDFNSYEDP